VRSGKLETGVDKGDMREKKTTVKHEHEIMILLTFKFFLKKKKNF
jgi:hypothetical protein